MRILNEKVKLNDLRSLDGEVFFEDMVKCVVDVDKRIIAVSLVEDVMCPVLKKGR